MRQPAPVPDPFTTGAHRRAVLRAAGITDGQLRSSGYRSPFRGVHVAAALPTTARQRIREAALLLPPGGAVGGWAAAHLLGATGFLGTTAQGRPVPVLLCVPRSGVVRPRDGVRLLRSPPDDDVRLVDGVPVTSPARTAVDLVRLSVDPRHGVAALDALWAAGVVSPDEVREHLRSRPRLRGAPAVRVALDLASPGVRSPQETALRLLWVLDAGLPRPLANPRVTDLEGRHLGRPDLLDVDSGLVAEYDGRQHFEASAAAVDNVREEGLESAGLVVCRFTAVDVRAAHRRRSVWRLRAARERGLALRDEPRHWLVAS